MVEGMRFDHIYCAINVLRSEPCKKLWKITRTDETASRLNDEVCLVLQRVPLAPALFGGSRRGLDRESSL
jgi:hypothetical protein